MPGLEHATVSDATHPGILSCGADATLTDVARLMTTHHVHCVAVMGISHEGPGEKLVWGIISDLRAHGWLAYSSVTTGPLTVRVRLMT